MVVAAAADDPVLDSRYQVAGFAVTVNNQYGAVSLHKTCF
jgi:hypothetical protein